MPKIRTTVFVEAERSFTKGFVSLLTKRSTGTTVNETFSGFCIAIFFGASSPRTSEKYDIITVISTVDTAFITPIGITFTIEVEASLSASMTAKLCDAVALVKNPASVTPI